MLACHQSCHRTQLPLVHSPVPEGSKQCRPVRYSGGGESIFHTVHSPQGLGQCTGVCLGTLRGPPRSKRGIRWQASGVPRPRMLVKQGERCPGVPGLRPAPTGDGVRGPWYLPSFPQHTPAPPVTLGCQRYWPEEFTGDEGAQSSTGTTGTRRRILSIAAHSHIIITFHFGPQIPHPLWELPSRVLLSV